MCLEIKFLYKPWVIIDIGKHCKLKENENETNQIWGMQFKATLSEKCII